MDDDLEIFFDEPSIQRKVDELGDWISRDYAGKDLVLIGVLKGAAFFIADLARSITGPVEVCMVRAASYGAGTAPSDEVSVVMDIDLDIRGKHLLLVDCIVDTGRTFQVIGDRLRALGPASIESVALLDKKERRTVDVPVRYVGFEVPDRFLVGYGLDKAGQYRNLPYIAALKQENS